jgi:glutamate/aspartate transport system substrate-binding protein
MNRLIVLASLLFALVSPALAQQPGGTLAKVAETGRLAIGYVPDAVPMSFTDENGRPAGYSIELCNVIRDAVRKHLGLSELRVDYVPLRLPRERIEAVVSGKVDIECGATTITLGRREQVDFTLMTLITGASSLSLAEAGIANNAQLNGRRLAVVRDTTTERVLRRFLDINEFEAEEVRLVDTHEQGLKLLNSGEVDAHVADQIILTGQVISAKEPGNYRLAPDVFSYEPYGFMIRKGDSEFRLVADDALARFYRTSRIQRLYYDWFGRYGLRQTPVQAAMYQFQGLPD